MTKAIRIIPCLDLNGGRVVKGIQFANLQDAGDPIELALKYVAEGASEITFLDVSATVEGRATTLDTLTAVAGEIDIPITVGGGVRSADDAAKLIEAGASKVSVNSAAIARPELLSEIASKVGSQALTLSIDARRGSGGATSGFEVTTHGGQRGVDLDAVDWARQAQELGTGEILLNSIDADGTKDGFDLEMLRAVREAVTCDLIASGGAGTVADFTKAAEAGADAVLAASVFHFGIVRISDVKEALREAGCAVV